MRTLRLIAVAMCAAALAGCGAGSAGVAITSVNPTSPSYAKLQFAVGTANIYGAAKGLNVVSTLRQTNGQSAIGASTPSIAGPFTFGSATMAPANGADQDPYTTIPNFGPSLSETRAAAPAITGTSQLVQLGTPYCDGTGSVPANFTSCTNGIPPNATTFGQSGGVFAMGIAPYNSYPVTGQAYGYAPYPQPLYDDGSAHPLFVPWGGPPAFDPNGDHMGYRDGLTVLGNDTFGQAYFLGLGEGVIVFEGLAAGSGTYKLNVAVATIGSGGSQNVTNISQTANMSAGIVLPTITAPAVVPDADGDGGASLSVTLPAGVTEELVQIVDWGPVGTPGSTGTNCQGPKGPAFAPVYYTIEVSSSGTFSLPATDGPNTNIGGGIHDLVPSPSICTRAQNNAANTPSFPVADQGDTISVQAIGVDYPLYEAVASLEKPLGSVPQTPQIGGSKGQSDITISAPIAESDPGGYVPTPLSGHRRPAQAHAYRAWLINR